VVKNNLVVNKSVIECRIAEIINAKVFATKSKIKFIIMFNILNQTRLDIKLLLINKIVNVNNVDYYRKT
jgi:hypothetical protein